MDEISFSTKREINCVIHWYQTWSKHQKEVFLSDLVEKALPNKVNTNFKAVAICMYI